MLHQAKWSSLPDDQVKTIHTEIVLADDRKIGIDLYCTESHLKEFRESGNGYIYEPEIIAAIMNFVKPGDTCIDAGANLGYHSILMAKMVGKAGQVLSFEPDPTCIDKLKNNFALNDVGDICFPAPVALLDDTLIRSASFFINECGYGSFMKFANVEQIEVQVEITTLDAIMNPDMKVRMLKIDCEGADEKVLHGAEQLLKRGVDAVIVEFNFNLSKNDKEIRQYMHSLGYDLFYLWGDGRFPYEISPDAVIQRSEKRFLFNGLFSRQSFVKENWKTSLRCGDCTLVPIA
jgi:FkbM family methyltransferase